MLLILLEIFKLIIFLWNIYISFRKIQQICVEVVILMGIEGKLIVTEGC